MKRNPVYLTMFRVYTETSDFTAINQVLYGGGFLHNPKVFSYRNHYDRNSRSRLCQPVF